jgi:hypothetical protein
MGDKVPGTNKQLQMTHNILNMPVALPDLLSSNGKKIFMRFQSFDLDGKRLGLTFSETKYAPDYEAFKQETKKSLALAKDQSGEDAHLFSGTGFLDDSWWHRTYWLYGKHFTSGWNDWSAGGGSGAPAGRMITFDDEGFYTWGLQKFVYYSVADYYVLRAKNQKYETQWETMLPIFTRAMISDDTKLYALGPKEIMRQPAMSARITEASVQEKMKRQEEHLLGQHGSILCTIDKQSGKILSGLSLDSVPEHDGMAAAYGQLYISMIDGTLVCLGAQGKPLQPLQATEIATLNENATYIHFF